MYLNMIYMYKHRIYTSHTPQLSKITILAITVSSSKGILWYSCEPERLALLNLSLPHVKNILSVAYSSK